MTYTKPKKWTLQRMEERSALAKEREAIRKDADPLRRRVREISFSRKLIDAGLLASEADLDQTRWIQYGYMSPLERTERFSLEYLKAVRRFHEKYIDAGEAQLLRPVDTELFKNKRDEISALWRARQCADSMGIPYGLFFRAVEEWTSRQGKRKHYPRPNQLYGSGILDEAATYWDTQKPITHPFGDDWDDRFFKANPNLDPPRREAICLVLKQAKDKPASAVYKFGALLGNMGALTEPAARHIALKMFPEQPTLINEAMKIASTPANERHATSLETYFPPCFGLLDAVTAFKCGSCPVILNCQSARSVAREWLRKQTGSSDPRTDAKKVQARDRKRRQRDRERQKQLDAKAIAITLTR